MKLFPPSISRLSLSFALVLLLISRAMVSAQNSCGQDLGKKENTTPNPAETQAENQKNPAVRRFAEERRQLRGVSNFGQVTPTLFRGAQPSPEGFKALAKMGVNIIVDARGNRSDTEGQIVSKLGMEYVAIPWNCPFPRDETFAKFLKLMRDNPGKKVFVHCRLGDDRTGMMIAAYRMAEEGWSPDDAMQEMQQFGYTPIHHYLICPRLAWYEGSFPEHLKKNPIFQGLYSENAPR